MTQKCSRCEKESVSYAFGINQPYCAEHLKEALTELAYSEEIALRESLTN